MKVADFDFELPPDRIAQHPREERDASRLMALSRASGMLEHHRFRDLPTLLSPGDLLVLNDTRVMPARLAGRKPSGGRVEVLLLGRARSRLEGEVWRCLLRASHRPARGTRLAFSEGLSATVLEAPAGECLIHLESKGEPVQGIVERIGRMPLPPYIKRSGSPDNDAADRDRYQTVFAARPGAVAAPTAGLHFSEKLLRGIEAGGVELAKLTLHVGPGTFQPVRCERVEDHPMHGESYVLPESVAEAVARTRSRGGRVVAVGTTVIRVLEHRAVGAGEIEPGSGECDLFIYPGFRFRVVDALITNFHLPRSTLIMLISAFAGVDPVRRAYREALGRGYRFYSYGDAMFVS